MLQPLRKKTTTATPASAHNLILLSAAVNGDADSGVYIREGDEIDGARREKERERERESGLIG